LSNQKTIRKEEANMTKINPYQAVIFHPIVHMIEKTSDMMKNVEHTVNSLKHLVGSPDHPAMTCSAELPVKLIVLPEAFCTGWRDEYLDCEHVYACKNLYNTTVPGPETDLLGEAAKYTGAYIMGVIHAIDPEIMEDRFFNVGFILNPEGKVILKHRKTSFFFRERTCSPHDIFDRYIEIYGNDAKSLLQAIYPVVKTEIGNLAITVCGEGDKPEVYRALAMNGAEVIARCTYMTGMYEQFELQNRAHAHFNNCYVLGPNYPIVYLPGETQPAPGQDTVGHIIDYRGTVIARSQQLGALESVAFAIMNVEELRYYRFHSLWQNWLPQLRMEEYILPYQYALDIGGLYPVNLGMDQPVMSQKPHDDLLRWCINRAAELGIYTPPDGWEPFRIPKELVDLIQRSRKRTKPVPKSRPVPKSLQ
jgi:beta-ureidopropionase